MSREDVVIEKIEEDLRLQYEHNTASKPGQLDKKWELLTSTVPKQFINEDLTIKRDVIRDFRKWTIFIPDLPIHNKSFHFLKKTLSGAQRASRVSMREHYAVLKENGYLDLLKKYPCNSVGNPNIYEHEGCRYTERWGRHTLFTSVFNNVLGPKINNDFVLLDIGSSYGIFSYFIKNEYPKSTHVLLDFPEQLVLAAYYLGMSFPQAKIAGYKELMQAKRIDREFLKKYDFVLLPWTFYKNIARGAVDVVSNFASLGEMRREWFDYYMKSEPFLSAKYFFCVNRFQSAPTYDTDLTILDYPINDFKRLHFRICPYFSHTYVRKFLFFYRQLNFTSQYFEFIGERP
jgi:putative sugar O-methyltransferase